MALGVISALFPLSLDFFLVLGYFLFSVLGVFVILGDQELGRLGKHHGEVRGDGFSFAVRVAREIDGIGGCGALPQVVDHFSLAGNDLEGWLENPGIIQGDDFQRRFRRGSLSALFALLLFLSCVYFVFINGQTNADRLGGQVHNVAHRGLDGVILAQIFIDRLGLGRRLDDNQ